MEKLLTREELAEQLGVSARTIDRWRDQGLAPPELMIQRVIRFRQSDIEAWLDDKTGSSKPEEG